MASLFVATEFPIKPKCVICHRPESFVFVMSPLKTFLFSCWLLGCGPRYPNLSRYTILIGSISIEKVERLLKIIPLDLAEFLTYLRCSWANHVNVCKQCIFRLSVCKSQSRQNHNKQLQIKLPPPDIRKWDLTKTLLE